jgi:hypothetical protein|tara:strand:+ start:243 stop:617 length:375 start_codon:yes stop_codon:yes gene_type:complete
MDDKQKIENVVQLYFDSMHESSPEKVREAFHPNAKITGFLKEDVLAERSVEDFAAMVGSVQPSPKEKGDEVILEIISCEIAGSTASVRVRDAYVGRVFLDTLSFLKENGEWTIYNKLFHIEHIL